MADVAGSKGPVGRIIVEQGGTAGREISIKIENASFVYPGRFRNSFGLIMRQIILEHKKALKPQLREMREKKTKKEKKEKKDGSIGTKIER